MRLLHDLALSLVGSGLGPQLLTHALACLPWLQGQLETRLRR